MICFNLASADRGKSTQPDDASSCPEAVSEQKP